MSLRVRALWRTSPRITLGIRVFYTIGWMATLILVIISLQSIQKYTEYYAFADTCYVDNRIPYMFLVTLIPLAIEFVFTTMTAIKTYQNVRIITGVPLTPLFRVFIRDGFLYFCTITFLGISNAVVWAFLPSTLMYLGLYIYFACMTTFICRFYINLLKVANEQRATMPSRLSTKLEFRSRREELIMGEGEFEVTESMIRRDLFVDDEENLDEIQQDVLGHYMLPRIQIVTASTSSLTAGDRTEGDREVEIRDSTDSGQAIVQSKE